MTFTPINPYHIIETLTEEVAQLKKENKELRAQLDEEENNEALADSNN